MMHHAPPNSYRIHNAPTICIMHKRPKIETQTSPSFPTFSQMTTSLYFHTMNIRGILKQVHTKSTSLNAHANSYHQFPPSRVQAYRPDSPRKILMYPLFTISEKSSCCWFCEVPGFTANFSPELLLASISSRVVASSAKCCKP